MKTHITYKGKQIALLPPHLGQVNSYETKINEILLALEEAPEPQKPFSVDNPPKDYIILKSSMIDRLQDMVIQKLEEGYRCVGGVCVDGGSLMQAVVRDIK